MNKHDSNENLFQAAVSSIYLSLKVNEQPEFQMDNKR